MEHDETNQNLIQLLVNHGDKRFTEIRFCSRFWVLFCLAVFILSFLYAICSAVNVLKVEIPHLLFGESVGTADTTYKISRHRPITDDDGKIVNLQYKELFLDQIDTNVYEYLETKDHFIFELNNLQVREFYFNRVRDVKVRYLISNPSIFYPYGSIVDSYAIKNVFIPLVISFIFMVAFILRFSLYYKYRKLLSSGNFLVVRRTNEFETKKFTHRGHTYHKYAAWYALDLPGGEQLYFLGKNQTREPEGETINKKFEFRVYVRHPEDENDNSYYMERLVRNPKTGALE